MIFALCTSVTFLRPLARAYSNAQRAIRSEARSAALALNASFDIARHYRNAVLPLRTIVRDEALLTYNGMITNTFELLADIRAATNTVLQEAQARRNYWLAEANAVAVVYGGSSEASMGPLAEVDGPIDASELPP